MVGPRDMLSKVECYAGYKGEQTPRAIVQGDRRIAVDDVLDQWLAPDDRYFKIRGDDGDVYIVRQDVASGEWTLTMFERQRTTNDERPTTNDQRPTTNDERPTTNDERPTTKHRRLSQLGPHLAAHEIAERRRA